MNRLFLSSLLFFLYLHRVSTIDFDIKATVPNAIDWRNRGKVNKIKNRGTCKASWAFAITSALETTYAVKFNTLFDLSEQHLIDCVSDNSRGCDYGDSLYGAMYVKRKGIMKTDKYPYKASDSQTCGYQARYSVKAPNFYYYTDDEDGLREIVSTIGPVVVGIKLPASAQNFTSGVFKDKACENVNWFDSINEYMTIVGYGTFNLTQPFWVLRHSLGSSWGRNGYLYLPRGSNYCGLMIEPIYFEYV